MDIVGYFFDTLYLFRQKICFQKVMELKQNIY